MDLVDILIEQLQSLKTSHIRPEEVGKYDFQNKQLFFHHKLDSINTQMMELYNAIVESRDHNFGPLIERILPFMANTSARGEIIIENNDNDQRMILKSQWYETSELILAYRQDGYEFISYKWHSGKGEGRLYRPEVVLSLDQAIDLCEKALCWSDDVLGYMESLS